MSEPRIKEHRVPKNSDLCYGFGYRVDGTGIPFGGHPSQTYYTVHDILAVLVFLTAFSAIVLFAPGGKYFPGAHDLFGAHPLATPPHIVPAWYFTPFYSMLRATTALMIDVLCALLAALGLAALVRRGLSRRRKARAALVVLVLIALLRAFDAKFWGLVVLGASFLLLYFVPWLDRSPVRSLRYRPGWHKALMGTFGAIVLALGYLGTLPSSPVVILLAQALTIAYFAFFLSMPAWSRRGAFRPLPERERLPN